MSMMAKNVTKKKIRIAHNKYALDSLETSGCHDFVTKIMNDMDSNLICNNLTALADSAINQKSTTQKEYLQCTSQNQAQSTNIFKAKRRLCSDKKFPLMEKSQKFLKQLKHNRKMPKPRAHLASLPKSLECIDKKSETQTKMSSNSRKAAPSPRASVTTNKASNVRENFKKSESNRKLGNSRNVGLNESVTNKTSNTRDMKKSEANTKVTNNSRKVSPNESETTYQISPWHNNSKVNTLVSEKTKTTVAKKCSKKYETLVTKKCSKKDETVVTKKCSKKDESLIKKKCEKNKKKIFVRTKKCSKKDDCSSVSDTDDIRNECSDSDSSDSDFEKFVQTQRKESNMKKRRKKQPAIGKKKTRQKSSIQKPEDLKKGAKVKSLLQYDSDSIVRTRKRRKVNNKSTNYESSDEESNNKFSPRSEDEVDPGDDDFYDNDVYTRDSSDDETVLKASNTESTDPKLNEQSVTSEENSLEMESNSVSNELSVNNPNVNDVYSRDSSSDDDTVLNAPNNKFMESESKNEQIFTEVKPLRVANNLGVNELSASHPNVVFNSTSNAKELPLAQESAESPILIDLSLSDNECESTNSVPQVISNEKSEANKAVMYNLPNTSNCQSDDESDIEIVDVIILSDMKEDEKVADNHSVDKSNVDLHIKIEKGAPLEDKTQSPQNITGRQKIETVIKHEPVFSTDICQKPLETDLNSTPVINNNVVINQREIKKETDDIIVLNDQTASTSFVNSSQISPVVSSSINTNVKQEITASKRRNSAENVTNAGESVPSKEKLLYEVACTNIKTLLPNDKPTKFSSLSVDDMSKMDVKTLMQMFKTEFQTYQHIIETQESIGYSFKMLENRQAEKLLYLKTAIKKYIGSSELDSSNIDFPLEKTASSDPKLVASNSGMSSLCPDTVCNPVPGQSHSQASIDFSQANLVPLSSVLKDIKPDVSELWGMPSCDQKIKNSSNMSFGEKCVVCSKDALAACQQCAKVFFCSNKCGEIFWNAGHGQLCNK